MNDRLTILQGHVLERLAELPAGSVHCCVTSPPYFGLRDYGVSGQIGLEPTPAEYVANLVAVFQEVWRVLRADGTLWMNLGDSYSNSGCGPRSGGTLNEWNSGGRKIPEEVPDVRRGRVSGLPDKNLLGIPWRVALALQADGWYLRMDIIWHKNNPMPESVTDRPTKAHEYIFLLTKSPSYYYDAEAILEPVSDNTHARISQDLESQIGSDRANGGMKTNGRMKAVFRKGKTGAGAAGVKNNASFAAGTCCRVTMRNKRSVWTVPTFGVKDAHFATYPPDLIKPCIMAGSPVGGVVLDPFAGSGTTGMVALELGRKAVLIELNPDYIKLIERRCDVTPGLPIA